MQERFEVRANQKDVRMMNLLVSKSLPDKITNPRSRPICAALQDYKRTGRWRSARRWPLFGGGDPDLEGFQGDDISGTPKWLSSGTRESDTLLDDADHRGTRDMEHDARAEQIIQTRRRRRRGGTNLCARHTRSDGRPLVRRSRSHTGTPGERGGNPAVVVPSNAAQGKPVGNAAQQIPSRGWRKSRPEEPGRCAGKSLEAGGVPGCRLPSSTGTSREGQSAWTSG